MSAKFERTPCPSEECSACTGEACRLCGAGLTRNPAHDGVPCEHDVLDRHKDAVVEISLQSRPEPGSFGFCYECRDGLHEQCVGVPCACDCGGPAPRAPEHPVVDLTLPLFGGSP